MRNVWSLMVFAALLAAVFIQGRGHAGESGQPVVGSYFITGFDVARGTYGTYGNAGWAFEPIGMKAGKGCAKVILGGVNGGRSGAMQVFGAEDTDIDLVGKSECDRLTFWLKGDGGSGTFVVIVVEKDGESWVWGGKRWAPDAQISLFDKSWRQVTLPFGEFVLSSKVKGGNGRIDPQNLKGIQFAVGSQLDEPEKQFGAFWLDDVCLASKSGKVYRRSASGLKLGGKAEAVVDPEIYAHSFPVNWDIEQHYTERTATRENVCLNNYWQYQPVKGTTVPGAIKTSGLPDLIPDSLPRVGPWGFMKVPGRWDTCRSFYVLDRDGNRIEERDGIKLYEYMRSWVRREIALPKSWKGKRIILDFSLINERAYVFVNGARVGAVHKSGKLDITGNVSLGRTNEIALRVQCPTLPVKKTHGRHKEFATKGMGAKWWYGWHEGPGIPGDVWLRAIPQNVVVENAGIVTSVRHGLIQADVTVKNQSASRGDYLVSFGVYDGGRLVQESYGGAVHVEPQMPNRISLSMPWDDAKLWSPQNPHMYEMRVALKDEAGVLVDEVIQKFGFREISLQGSSFCLNGRKIRLNFSSNQYPLYKLNSAEIEKLLLEMKAMNFNGLIVEHLEGRIIDICDRIGMMVAVRHVFPPLVRTGEYLPGVTNVGYPYTVYLSEDENAKAGRAEMENTIRSIVLKYRNNPSIMMWMLNPLLCYTTNWIDPNNFFDDRNVSDIVRAAYLQESWLRNLDPTRLVQHSMGGNTGDIIACNPYPLFQNRPDGWADWPVKWAKDSRKPLVLEEVSVPYRAGFSTWYINSKSRNAGWSDAKQLLAEQSARSFGEDVYRRSLGDVDKHAHSAVDAVVEKDGFRWNMLSETAQKVYALWVRRCFEGWRFYGVSGIWPFFGVTSDYFNNGFKNAEFTYEDLSLPGKKPDFGSVLDFSRKTLVHAAMKKAQAPLLVRIGGRKGAFTSLAHTYVGGEKIEKQILVSSNLPDEIDVKCALEMVRAGDGKVVFKKRVALEVNPGDVIRYPVLLDAPNNGGREVYEIKLNVDAGEYSCSDVFEVTVLPQSAGRNWVEPVLLYDEAGKTSALLKSAGVKYRVWDDAQDLKVSRLLVVGRESFTGEFLKKAIRDNLRGAIEKGMTVLVFEQNGKSLLAPYLEERRCRRVFVRSGSHPVLDGIAENDLHHWRGESDMVPAYTRSGTAGPGRFIMWGTEGVVSSYVMDKPVSGRFRAIIDCDADLSRTPMLEYMFGGGRFIFCQLDVTGRYGKDVTATKITDNLLAYAMKPRPWVEKKAVYAGGGEYRKLLDDLKVNAANVKGEDDLSGAQVLILGEDSGLAADSLNSFVEDGGSLIVLARDAEKLKALGLDVDMNVKKVKTRGAVFEAGDMPLLEGLGVADFYFNQMFDATVVECGGTDAKSTTPALFTSVARGKGRVLFVQVSPDMFPDGKPRGVTYDMSWMRQKAKRAISVILANCGVGSSPVFGFGENILPEIVLSGKKVAFRTDPQALGTEAGWMKPGVDDSGWDRITLGRAWEHEGVTQPNPHYKADFLPMPYDGDAWYRVAVEIPEEYRQYDLSLKMEKVDDMDWVYLNGKKIGSTGKETKNYWDIPRSYKLPKSLIRFGEKNCIAVRVSDLRGNGGIIGKARLTWPGAKRDLLYVRPSRTILDFDPNRWRQW